MYDLTFVLEVWVCVLGGIIGDNVVSVPVYCNQNQEITKKVRVDRKDLKYPQICNYNVPFADI